LATDNNDPARTDPLQEAIICVPRKTLMIVSSKLKKAKIPIKFGASLKRLMPVTNARRIFRARMTKSQAAVVVKIFRLNSKTLSIGLNTRKSSTLFTV
jgi:hypothetical protein